MNRITHYRVAETGDDSRGTLLYLKIADPAGETLFNLIIAHDGIYYFPAHSPLLTPEEKADSDASYTCDMNTRDIKLLFEALIAAGLNKLDWKISAENEKVTIEKGYWESE